MKNRNPVTDYALSVIEGNEPAGKLIRRACERHLRDLERDDIFLDERHVEFVFKFLRLCKHHKGEWAGKPIELAPAQEFIVGSLFGWKRSSDGLRRFRTAYIEVPRKNGKSTLLSAVSLVLLIIDNESGAEIYSAATKEEQAKIVWGDAREMVRKSSALSGATTVRHNSILFPKLGSIYRPLGSDSKTQDGLNPHAVIADELHAWPGRDLWDVLEDAFGARTQPMMIAITTAGTNRNGICYQQRQHVVNILDVKSQIKDDSYFGFIATIDEEDQDDPDFYMNPAVWRKANPMLGVSKSEEYMTDMAAKARAMPGKLATFLNKQLNVWTDGQELMWDMVAYDRCGGEIDLEKLKGETCWAGLDLSTNRDITALVFLFPPGPYDRWTIFPRFYIPEDSIREAEARDKVPYREWVDKGLIEATPGDFIDLEFIKKDFLEYADMWHVRECGYDPWKATEIANWLEQQGQTMVLMRQGHGTLSPAVTALEKNIAKGELLHGDNPVLRWMFANCTGRRDPNMNIIPDKKNSYSRIDGVSALLNATGRAIVADAEPTDIYKNRGIDFI